MEREPSSSSRTGLQGPRRGQIPLDAVEPPRTNAPSTAESARMLPSRALQTPTSFARWKQTRALFDDTVTVTETFVINDQADTGLRRAFGWSPDGYWFHVSMTIAEEPEFWHAYLAWRGRNLTGAHEFISAPIGRRPPARLRNTPASR